MSQSRMEIVESNLDRALESLAAAPALLPRESPLRPGTALTAREAVAIFEDQALSRALDVAARELKKSDKSYYTISSAGHEQNAVVGALLRPDDPCFLHYRSGGLMMARARQVCGQTPLFDTLLSLCASAEDPISQGRHKVWGSKRLFVPPQTSTIASHVPKAVGFAFALSRVRRLGRASPVSKDAIVCCSFGDASINHATALTGINAARYAHRRGNAVPILFLCEDNGIGISVDTPRRWIAEELSRLPHLRYFLADGEVDAVYDACREAIECCRSMRAPVFLHLNCVRLWGHAGSDVETTYRTLEEIAAIEAQDPILRNARRLAACGAAAPETLRAILRETRARVRAAAPEAASRRKLSSAEEVMAPLSPYDESRCRAAAKPTVSAEERVRLFDGALPEKTAVPTKRTLAAHVNAALADAMLAYPEMVLFGEDVGKKGGVYYVTAGLQRKFSIARVFDTLLDETTILGTAQGAAQAGLLPVPEIQYLAYLHNAIDQIRGEACSLSFFSAGQFRNPMVVRVASFAYQRGFGGHFHNDNAIAALREIPGLFLAAPSRGDDAARMLRGLLAAAREFGSVACFLEPIALYHEKDLHEEGDGGWLTDYPPPPAALFPGEIGLYHGDARDVLIVSYANGLRLSLRAARRLSAQHGVRARVIDLRWLAPLPLETVGFHAAEVGRVVVVDECRASGGVADAVLAGLFEGGFSGRARSVRSRDTYIPLGPAANTVLVSEEEIVRTVLETVA